MVDARWFALALSALLVVAVASPMGKVRARRQLADDNTLQPIEDAEGDEQTREKRKFEGVTQAKFGIKNAVLGFVFGDGITSRRQVRSTSPERVSLLPTSATKGPLTNNWGTPSTDTRGTSNNWGTARTNSQDPLSTNMRGTASTDTRGTSNNRDTARTNSQDTLSTNIRGTATESRGTASNTLGAIEGTSDTRGLSKSLSSSTKVSSISSDRGTRQADDIPVFDRNKVSLDFPGALFGPSLSLLIKTTKIVGDVIQNSAVRYQSFLRLFRPLFRGPFEIKGLDPPTTTTTTTTTTTKAPVAADNEVRRR